MSTDYPRVLIINHQSIYTDNATGITLRSLWEKWPTDNAFELSLDPYGKLVESNLEIRSEIIPSNGIRKIAHSGTAQKVNQNMKGQVGTSRNSLKGKIRQAAVLSLDLLPSVIPEEILDKLDQFKPEVIYTLGASVTCLRMVNRLHKRYSIPIVVHFMDNWVEHLQWDNNLLIKPYKRVLKKLLNKCMKSAPVCFTISELMAKEYSVKYPNTSFASLMNSVNCSDLKCPKRSGKQYKSFIYTGGLHLDRWRGLLDIGKVLKEYNPGSTLKIYTSTNIDSFKNSFKDLPVEFHPPVPHKSIKEVFEEADCLVHVEVDNELLLGFFKYSISTKIPEYLSTGRVMLFYGPKTIGLYDYLSNNKVALVCSDYEELKVQINKLCSCDGAADDIAERAVKFAKEYHSIETAHRILQAGISDCFKSKGLNVV